MNLKILAVVLAVLLGGMAIYYNLSVSNNPVDSKGVKVESTK